MNDLYRLNESYSHIGVKLEGDNLLLVLPQDMGHGARFDSRLVFGFNPGDSSNGNVKPMFSEFTLSMNTGSNIGDSFWLVDLRSDKNKDTYAMDDVWKIMSKDHIFVEYVYFFNVSYHHSGGFKREIYDVLPIPVAVDGIMTFNIDRGAFEYEYNEDAQPSYNVLNDEVYNQMLTTSDDDTYDALLKYCDGQAYIFDSEKDIMIPKYGFR